MCEKFPTLSYTVTAHQFQTAGDTSPDIETAVSLYDADGELLNASVSEVPVGNASQSAYHMEQRVDAPLAARFLRIAVRDNKTNRIGVMEIPLPLAESQPAR